MGLVIHCLEHYEETLDLAFAEQIGISKKNEFYYEFPCGTIVILNDNNEVEDKILEYYDL